MCLKITVIKIATCCKHSKQTKATKTRTPKWIASHLDNISMDFHKMYMPKWKATFMDKIDLDIFQHKVSTQKTWVPTFLDDIEPEETDILNKFPSQWFNIPVLTTADTRVEVSDATLHQMMLQYYQDALVSAQRKQIVGEIEVLHAQKAVQVARKHLLKFRAESAKKKSEIQVPVSSSAVANLDMTPEMAVQVLRFFSTAVRASLEISPTFEASQNRLSPKVEILEPEITHCRQKQQNCEKARRKCARKIHNVFQPSKY